METQTTLAVPDEDGCLTIYTSCQGVDPVQQTIAKCLNIPLNNVRVITRRLGGSFGGKFLRNMQVRAQSISWLVLPPCSESQQYIIISVAIEPSLIDKFIPIFHLVFHFELSQMSVAAFHNTPLVYLHRHKCISSIKFKYWKCSYQRCEVQKMNISLHSSFVLNFHSHLQEMSAFDGSM